MNFIACLKLTLLLSVVLAAPVRSQSPLSPDEEVAANRLFAASSQGEQLRCSIEGRKPSPAFTFRFEAGYVVRCAYSEFGGEDSRATIFVRITPEGGTPVLLGSFYIFRGSHAKLFLIDPSTVKAEFDVSGGFFVGEGRYHVDVLVADSQNRTSRRQWKIEVTHRQQAKVPVVLAAHTVSALNVPPWDGPVPSSEGLRLTVLLDAAPLYIRSVRSRVGRIMPPDGGALKLRAWDQAFLLQFLSSLLQKTPCQSVRLVAFNLDQQREILRAEPFVPYGFASLQEAFRDLELGTVSAQVLKQRQGWAQMLADLTNRELIAREPSDAVIFLGPSTRWWQKVPKDMLKPRETKQPRFFYFEYASSELPDAIGYLTKARDGTVFKIHSPHGLGQAIEKMLAQLKRVDQKADAGASRHRNSRQ